MKGVTSINSRACSAPPTHTKIESKTGKLEVNHLDSDKSHCKLFITTHRYLRDQRSSIECFHHRHTTPGRELRPIRAHWLLKANRGKTSDTSKGACSTHILAEQTFYCALTVLWLALQQLPIASSQAPSEARLRTLRARRVLLRATLAILAHAPFTSKYGHNFKTCLNDTDPTLHFKKTTIHTHL